MCNIGIALPPQGEKRCGHGKNLLLGGETIERACFVTLRTGKNEEKNHVLIAAYHSPALVFQYVYDHCLVWPFANGSDALVFKTRLVGGGADQLEHRPAGVLLYGTGQSFGVQGDRRAFFAGGTQGHPGGDHPDGLHHLYAPVFQERALAAQPPDGLSVSDRGGLFYFQEVA